MTGQYVEAEKLRDSLINNLGSLQMTYDEQVNVLKDEQKNGVTVKSATAYALLSEKVSSGYVELEKLVTQL